MRSNEFGPILFIITIIASAICCDGTDKTITSTYESELLSSNEPPSPSISAVVPSVEENPEVSLLTDSSSPTVADIPPIPSPTIVKMNNTPYFEAEREFSFRVLDLDNRDMKDEGIA